MPGGIPSGEGDSELTEKLAELEAVHEEFKENSARRIAELQDKIEKMNEERIDAETFREKDFEIENLMSQIDELQENQTKIEKDRDSAKAEYLSQIAELKSVIERKDTFTKTVADEKEQLETQLKAKKDELEVSRKEAIQKDTHISEKEEKIKTLLREKGEQGATISELEIKMEVVEQK